MQPTPAPRTCSVPGCEAPLRASNTIGRCREHAYIPATGPVCGVDGCGEVLRKDNRTGFCTPHKRAKSRGRPVPKQDYSARVYADRTCPDCRAEFTPHSANDERCPNCQHAHRLALRAEREGRNQRDTCSVDGCGAKLRTSNTIGRCPEHRYIPVDSPVCPVEGCSNLLRKDNDSGYCKAHKYASSREQARPCGAPGCDRTLRTDNTTGYCPDHAERPGRTPEYRAKKRAVYHAQPKPPDARRTCSADGCERKIRSDNTTGRCTDHAYIPLDLRVCPVDGCEKRLRSDSTVGRCWEHRGSYWADDAPKCSEPGCGKTLHADNSSGLCKQHYDETWSRRNNRAYYLRNQAALREYARQYREVYADEHRAGAIAWAAANPEARQAAHARRRRRVAADMDDTDRLLSVLYRQAIKGDPCFYCGSPVTHHVDHFFPLAKGGTDHWFNLVRSCQRCNLRKQAQCGTAFILRGRL
jgi:hypothetical protein